MNILINTKNVISGFLTVFVYLYGSNEYLIIKSKYGNVNCINSENIVCLDTMPFSFISKTDRNKLELPFDDSISSSCIYVLYSKERLPIGYCRNIKTYVCKTGECLPIEVNIYWNMAGRYVGFELPSNEILTKKDHIPFSKTDYKKLDRLLANPQSVLGTYSIEDLVQSNGINDKRIDAITSATVKVVNDVCVEGAVYTCYTLWHIANGQTARFIAKRAVEAMTPEGGIYLIKYGDISDISWLLNHVDIEEDKYRKLKVALINKITPDNFFVTKHILDLLTDNDLNCISIQTSLLNRFNIVHDYNIKARILRKLVETENPDSSVLSYFEDRLLFFPVILQVEIISLLGKMNQVSIKAIQQVKSLIENDNKFLTNKALEFLGKHNELQKRSKADKATKEEELLHNQVKRDNN
ncbi:hypothetical protein [Membranihabitans maritimus]|uniref:hypothetical protein n=1 Tax=Membranihabitans maritimus TaxID=2904244 RepID=UPI001F2D0469|nr:hypothetical protein [Membranihabitans maritimus]